MTRKLLKATVVLAALAIPSISQEAAAQTTLMEKDLERKFPTDFCPIDTEFLGSFTSTTGIIRLTFVTKNGYDDGTTFTHFEGRLDDITIIEASEFVPPNTREHDSCYFCEPDPCLVHEFDPSYQLAGNPKVPFYEPFSPLSSECPWDETNGATVKEADGWMEMGSPGLGAVTVHTNVVISGLTPSVAYLVHGRWSVNGFQVTPNCVPESVCLQVKVEELAMDCATVPVEEST